MWWCSVTFDPPSSRFWQQRYPEDFKFGTPLAEWVQDLQTVMTENGVDEMAEYIALDNM